MLVLSRKKDERFRLMVKGVEIDITVVRIDPNKVRLGIEADKDVIILRHELLDEEPPPKPN